MRRVFQGEQEEGSVQLEKKKKKIQQQLLGASGTCALSKANFARLRSSRRKYVQKISIEKDQLLSHPQYFHLMSMKHSNPNKCQFPMI